MTRPALRLANVSIRRKLTLVMMLTCGLAMLFAFAAFAGYEVVTARQHVIGELGVAADIIAANSTAALAFWDRAAAEDSLKALRADPSVTRACIYGASGRLLASYANGPATSAGCPAKPRAQGAYFEWDRLELVRPIALNGETVGTILLRADLRQLYRRLKRYLAIALLVFAISCVAALALAGRLQSIISAPILHLAGTARQVTAEKNYAARAAKQGDDEIGALVDDFNDMLSEIERRDEELACHREHLEEQVAARTDDLVRLNSELLAAKKKPRRWRGSRASSWPT